MARLLTLLASREAPAPSGPSVFTPASLSGCRLWLDAQDTASLTKDGGNRVSGWADKSGRSHHAVQATASLQPLYAASGINGLPAIRFYDDGTLNPLIVLDHADFNFTSLSVFAVFQRDSDANSSQALLGQFTQATNHRGWVLWGRRAASPAEASLSTSRDGTGTTQVNADKAALINTPYIADAEYSAGGMHIAVNNGARTSVAQATVHQAAADLIVGGINAGTAGQFRGFIGELIFFNQALSAAERQAMLQYLAEKWNIAIS